MPLHTQTQRKSIVHVGCLLELALALKSVRIFAVRRSGNPSNTVVSVECHSFVLVLFADDLHTVVVDEDGGGAALARVGLHSFLEGEYRGCAVRGDG